MSHAESAESAETTQFLLTLMTLREIAVQLFLATSLPGRGDGVPSGSPARSNPAGFS